MQRSTILVAALITGCTQSGPSSNESMNALMGQSVASAAVRAGPPIAAFDMGDGRRAFQWKSTSWASYGGHQSMVGKTALTSPVYTQEMTCRFTLYAKGGAGNDLSSWKIVGYEPAKEDCG